MVIQRGKPIRIWGWAKADQKVSIQFGQEKIEAAADFPVEFLPVAGETFRLVASSTDLELTGSPVLMCSSTSARRISSRRSSRGSSMVDTR